MLRNYLLVALRLLKRNPVISAINIGGLAIAMTATLIILQYVTYHLSYDNFLTHAERIYRLGSIWGWTDSKGTQVLHTTDTHTNTINQINDDFPEVEGVTWYYQKYEDANGNFLSDTRIFVSAEPGFRKDPVKSENFITADPGFLKVFDYSHFGHIDSGSLSNPNHVVISSQLAQQVFGHEDVLDKNLYVNGNDAKKISGVYSPPRNASLIYDLIFSTSKRSLEGLWQYQSFVKLRDGANVHDFERELRKRYPDYVATTLKRFSSVQAFMEPILQPMRSVHFGQFGNLERLKTVSFPRFTFWVLLIIGVLISGIAMVNYFNLSTSQLVSRNEEVSMRKVFGASPGQLVMQSWIESLLMMSIALIIAITLSQVIYPFMTQIGIEYAYGNAFRTWWFAPLIFIILILTSLIISVGQLLVLRKSFYILNTKNSVNRSANYFGHFQHMLLGVQFLCAMILIIGITILNRQINYILDKDLGFEKAGIFSLEAPRTADDITRLDSFFEEVQNINGVEDVSASMSLPGNFKRTTGTFFYRPEKKLTYGLPTNGPVEPNFPELFGLKILGGRSFKSDYPPDFNAVLLSEHAVHRLEFESLEEALNTRVMLNFNTETGLSDTSTHRELRVIGIFADYYIDPLHQIQEERGLALFLNHDREKTPYKMLHVKTKDGVNPYDVVDRVKARFENTFSSAVFDFNTVDEVLAGHYTRDRILRKVMLIFTGVAIVISCLGLIALTAILLIRKTKEIGIRKVLGAQLAHLYYRFAKSYLGLALIIAIIAVPISWMVAVEWLNGYAERIDLTWEIFVLPAFLLIAIIFLLLFFQVLRATRINPAESLRYE